MDLITLDFETYYADGYTLSGKDTTTESYVRDSRFEAILCSFKINDNPSFFVSRDLIPVWLDKLEIEKHAVLMHHAHFDALIANHHYGKRPKLILDTLGMARALHGANGRLSLAKLSERYGIGTKGDEVINARGMRYADFSPAALKRYGEYSCNDSDLTYELGKIMIPQFSKQELQINDHIIRMFTEPVLELDTVMLRAYADKLHAEKVALMMNAGAQLTDLMSNDKFAVLLQELGIDPPMKISPAWLKKPQAERKGDGMTFAFAKTDPGMQALQEHPDERVQILIEARLKNKTTLGERSAERLISMASRGPTTIYLKYSGASGTHRLGGGDKTNFQSIKRIDPSLPATEPQLRKAIMAPVGHKIVVGDSSNIEARILDWLAGQDDMVQVYIDADNKVGPDMYCVIAERIYRRPVNKQDNPQERQMGKVAKLGLGFGMGADKFITTVRGQAKDENNKPLIIDHGFSKKVVDIYRSAHPQVQKLWKRGESALQAIAQGQRGMAVDFRGIVKTCQDGLIMPGGLRILFPDLKFNPNDGKYGEWSFWNGKTREHIFGAKCVENIIQCLARIIVFEQCRITAKELTDVSKWVHSVHDEGVFVTPDFYAPFVKDRLLSNMRIPPAWCSSLPLNSEGGFNQRYGNAK